VLLCALKFTARVRLRNPDRCVSSASFGAVCEFVHFACVDVEQTLYGRHSGLKKVLLNKMSKVEAIGASESCVAR
jgi:hypothetical protein